MKEKVEQNGSPIPALRRSKCGMEDKNEQRVSLLVRLRGPGIMMLCGLLFFTGMYRFKDRAVPTSSSGGRKLPIYCVQTDEPRVALSFDAAWGGGWMRSMASQPGLPGEADGGKTKAFWPLRPLGIRQ